MCRFIKLDAAWLIKEGSTRFGGARIARLKKQLDGAGIDLIVEKIEQEATLRTLLDYHIDFGQGYLFGKPDFAGGVAGRRPARPSAAADIAARPSFLQ